MEFILGFLSNSVATTMCQPLDVIKTRVQTEQKVIWHSKGLYRGLGSSLGIYPLFWGVYFQSYSFLKGRLGRDETFIDKVCLSYVSGNLGSLVINPLTIFKTQLQSGKEKKCVGVMRSMGLRTLWTGFSLTMLNNCKIAIQFPLMDELKMRLDNDMLASGIAKSVANCLLYPTDLMRVKQRNMNEAVSIRKLMKSIYVRDGIRGFYRGLLIQNCVSVPQFVIMVEIINLVKEIRNARFVS